MSRSTIPKHEPFTARDFAFFPREPTSDEQCATADPARGLQITTVAQVSPHTTQKLSGAPWHAEVHDQRK